VVIIQSISKKCKRNANSIRLLSTIYSLENDKLIIFFQVNANSLQYYECKQVENNHFKDTKKYKRDSLKCVVNISMFFCKRKRERNNS